MVYRASRPGIIDSQSSSISVCITLRQLLLPSPSFTRPDRQRYRLIELLDPEISHCEFYLARPSLPRIDWSNDTPLLQAIPARNQCMDGWSSQAILDYKYQQVRLQETEYAFLEACDKANRQQTVETLMRETGIDLDRVRSLQNRQQILLTPTGLNQ